MIVPTNSFSLAKKYIRVKELYGHDMTVPALSVDSVIFDIIGKKQIMRNSVTQQKDVWILAFLWRKEKILSNSYGKGFLF
ncbi:hypothetical protein [Prevotella amnii]|uniref:hypothetical protein n=1 Tax=Prevotella amnii TaxID=419005 RepID=UPI0003649803|nr:hypothetical protein [Prevotella amnii]